MKIQKKLVCLVAAAALAGGCLLAGGAHPFADKPLVPFSDSTTEDRQMDNLEFAKSLKIGWNLGNTFDAPAGETAWGNPLTTEELIRTVKELGFDTIRIPISWGLHVSPAPEYTIQEGFLKRVDTVVRSALDAGFYVIINSHHDNSIYSPTPDNSQRGQEYLTAIWTQIGEHFRDADEHLIFETMNEPRVEGSAYEWEINAQNPDCIASLEVVNELNQAALNAIRATGGNNAQRYVIISPYAGSPGAAMTSAFRLPEDSAEGKLIVSIHAYTPYSFALSKTSGVSAFTKAHENEIVSLMKSLNYRFLKKGIPVVIDEMGCMNKDNPDDRYAWCKAYISAAKEYGIPCIWWDNGAISGSGENFAIINRRKCTVFAQSELAYQGLMDGLAATE